MRIITLISILVTLISCQNNEEAKEVHPLDKVQNNQSNEKKTPINLFQLDWMSGIWIDSISFPQTTVIEDWKVKGDTIFGKRGTIKNSDTTFSQLSKIFINNEQPVYLLEQDQSAFIVFKTKEFTSTSITFGNIANAAPTSISYQKQGINLGLSFTTVTPAGDRTFKHLFTPLKN